MGELAALFAASFVAATLFPLPSEAALFAYLQVHPESKTLAVSVATVGNTAGGMTSYLLGRVIPRKKLKHAKTVERLWRAGPPARLAAARRRCALRRGGVAADELGPRARVHGDRTARPLSGGGLLLVMRIRPFEFADEPAVIALWEECKLTRPWNDPHKDIARKLAVQPELFLVGVIDRFRGQGHAARALMQHVEALLLERGCPKVSLLVRNSNREALEFYRHLGYAQDEAVSLGKRLIPD